MAICFLCGQKSVLFNHTIGGGKTICSKCYEKCGFTSDMIDSEISVERCKDAYEKATYLEKARKEFKPTRKIDACFAVNENDETWVILGHQLKNYDAIIEGPFKYDNLDEINLCEDGTTLNKISMKKVLFGTHGQGIRDKGKCNYLYIEIKLRDTYKPYIKFNFISSVVEKSSDKYAFASSSAEKCYSLLESMKQTADSRRAKEAGTKEESTQNTQNVQAAPAAAAPSSTISQADELIKFKQLLDMGIITEEEFNIKKEEFKKASFNK